ncbi:hypothetical protein WMY93_020489 [Mugilogobius chulae]|uniref:SH3 domain-binding protein 5 n=1 Tax=Mugilogobius chulae TaxID=88201 RepID=A0AAW0NU27_9GOBI
MEPGTVRDSSAGSGCPQAAGLREETPGEEARGGEGGGSTVMSKRKGEDIPAAEEARAAGEEEHREAAKSTEDQEGKYEEELDPRIQEELEHLNQASEEINKLELQLDDARSSYRRILTDSARKLNAQGSALGACIEKARPYYEARRLAKEAQQETQKAALRYERAVSMHSAAREMEMLNHATAKVNEAEEERLRSEREHQRVTQLCQQAEARVQTLQKSLKKVILKSKPYFELKAQFNHILEEHKSKVVHLEEQVSKVKTRYSVALRNLEQISEQIHAQRGRIPTTRGSHVMCGGRSSPVGAEAEVRASVSVQVSVANSDWAQQWVERHRQSGWGHAEEGPEGSDRLSVISLQTIASDLEKCDSVEHLGDISDCGSVRGDEWERRTPASRPLSTVLPSSSSAAAAAVEVVLVVEGPGGVQGSAFRGPSEQPAAVRKERRESFVKQHHRSVSL